MSDFDWEENVKPLPDGGGELLIETLEGDTVSVSISGQVVRVGAFPRGEIHEVLIIPRAADGGVLPPMTHRILRRMDGGFELLE